MFKMEIPVVIQSVRAKKDDKTASYVDFAFTGGVSNLEVSDEKLLKQLPEGELIVGVFQMNSRQSVMFGRPVTGFFPAKLLEVKKG